MKDSLFKILLNFFEKTLSQLNENYAKNDSGNDIIFAQNEHNNEEKTESQSILVRAAHANSIRVFTYEEQMKFTKASYQFLMRMLLWGVIASESMELIINQLLFSESRIITLQETKWTIRNSLAENLNAAQLAFLDLVLYQKEDKFPLH